MNEPTTAPYKPTHADVVTTTQFQGQYIFLGYKREDTDGKEGWNMEVARIAPAGTSTAKAIEVPVSSLSKYVAPNLTKRDAEVRESLAAPVPARGDTRPAVAAVVGVLIAALMSLSFTGCGSLTADQKTALATTGSTIASQVINAAVQYGVANFASNLKGNPYADSAASALWSLTGKTAVTSADVKNAIASFGDPNKSAAWNAFGSKVAQIVTTYGLDAVTKETVNAAAIAVSQLGHGTPPPPQKV